MARRATGYSIMWRGERRGYTVRFRLDGQRRELALGVRDRRAKADAEARGRETFASHVKGQGQRPKASRSKDALGKALERWVTELAVREDTSKLYAKYGVYWGARWSTVGELTTPAIAAYVRSRLRVAKGKSVSNEASALRQFLAWLVESGLLKEAPQVPRVRRSEGTRYKHRRRTAAPEYSPLEMRNLIAALPELSEREGWPVRARALVAYQTSLRPKTLDVLRVPENYSRGSKTLRLTDSQDKEAFGRELPLTAEARKVLDSVCPDVGLIFGKHRLDPYLREAAKVALSPDKALVFTGQHFRSAALTHMLERGAPLPGVQWLAGHRHVSTTARYVRSSFRAAIEATKAWGTASGDRKQKPREK